MEGHITGLELCTITYLVVVRFHICRRKCRYSEFASHQRKDNENQHLPEFTHSFILAIPRKADIMKRDLEPRTPKHGKESDIGHESIHVSNGVICRERGQVGNKKQVKKQLQRVCFVSLIENQLI